MMGRSMSTMAGSPGGRSDLVSVGFGGETSGSGQPPLAWFLLLGSVGMFLSEGLSWNVYPLLPLGERGFLPVLGAGVGTMLLYSTLFAVFADQAFRWRVGDLTGMILLGSLYGLLLEGVFAGIVFAPFPGPSVLGLSLLGCAFPALSWHAALDFPLPFLVLRRLGRGSMPGFDLPWTRAALARVAAGVLFWASWTGFRLHQTRLPDGIPWWAQVFFVAFPSALWLGLLTVLGRSGPLASPSGTMSVHPPGFPGGRGETPVSRPVTGPAGTPSERPVSRQVWQGELPGTPFAKGPPALLSGRARRLLHALLGAAVLLRFLAFPNKPGFLVFLAVLAFYGWLFCRWQGRRTASAAGGLAAGALAGVAGGAGAGMGAGGGIGMGVGAALGKEPFSGPGPAMGTAATGRLAGGIGEGAASVGAEPGIPVGGPVAGLFPCSFAGWRIARAAVVPLLALIILGGFRHLFQASSLLRQVTGFLCGVQVLGWVLFALVFPAGVLWRLRREGPAAGGAVGPVGPA
ncbi:MAG: hypothetical protein GX442_20565 [Candidatus Riflebacteria bacterium]|nr:hypothetical protein [Candidatus Riflebacteria bacterium]